MDKNFDLICNDVKLQVRRAVTLHSIEPITQQYQSFQPTDKDLKPAFDQAFRDVQLELIDKEQDVQVLENLLTLSIEACRKELLTYSTPVTLLGDIFDLLTLDACKKMFVFVENHVNVWKEDLFFSNCKNILLRICNDLLRRLSKSNSTIFCGRILLFLAKFFPFSERSGLNIVSEFNLENITEYSDSCDIDEDIQKGKITINYSLYCQFWSLQDFFRNPSQCYDKEQWKIFCTNSASIVSTFEGLKLDHLEEDITDEDVEMHENATDNNYFPKYLTNQKLLDLQLYDVNFRRFVLLQFLVLFQYLTSTVRFKTGQELLPEQRQFVDSMTEKVHNLLKETPPDGVEFETIVNKILAREDYWNAWKNDGCQEFRKTLPTPSAGSETPPVYTPTPRVPLGDLVKEAASKGTYHMGNVELTKLWNLNPNNLDACRTKERDFLPSLEEFFGDLMSQAEHSEAMRTAFMDEGYCWRALRLLARRSAYFFTPANTPITELHVFLQKIVSRLQQKSRGGGDADDMTPGNSTISLLPDEANEPDEELKVQNILLFRVTVLTVTQFHNICKALQDDWQMLARKLHFPAGDIAYIVSHNSEPLEQARNLLNLWFEEDDDSTLENFLYILEGLGLSDAADVVKHAIEQNKNLTTDTSNSNEND